MRTLLLTIVLSIPLELAIAQEYEPPYMAHSREFLLTLFQMEVDIARDFVPNEIKLDINESGMVNAGFEIYKLDRISGFPNLYSVAFVFVEVEGFDTPNLPGHFIIWGVISDSIAAANLSFQYGYPFTVYEHIFLSSMGDKRYGIIGPNEKEIIKLVITSSEDKFASSGIVKMVGFKDSVNHYAEVPWINTGIGVKKVDLQVTSKYKAWNLGSKDTDKLAKILEVLTECKPYWSMISENQTFTYTRPLK